MINDLLKLFVESVSRKSYLDSVAGLIHRWVGCECVAIRLQNPAGGIHYESCIGFPQQFQEAERKLAMSGQECICLRLAMERSTQLDARFATGKGSLLFDVPREIAAASSNQLPVQFQGGCLYDGFASNLVIPMRWSRDIKGVIHLAGGREGEFSGDVVEFMESIIPIIAEAAHRFDISDALRESESKLRKILTCSPDAIVVANADGVIMDCNQAALVLHGASNREELLGKNAFDLIAPRDVGRALVNAHLAVMGGHARNVEYTMLRVDGSSFLGEMSCSTVYDSSGDPLYFVCVARDITDRKAMEERLLRGQRLETAGKIAGQVAHDFNNLLGPLVSYPELIKAKLPPDHPAIRYCDAMIEAAERMAEINTDLMALARRGNLEAETVDLNTVVEHALGNLGDHGPELVVETRLDGALSPTAGSPGQLLRIVANLIVNARDAMNDRGKITIETENVHLDRSAGEKGQIPSGEYVKLSVRDTGCGIAPEHREKIFEAFFTTKRKGLKRGSGLGLSIVQAIVEDHGGYLDLWSQPNEGSVFSVYLPVSNGAEGARPKNGAPMGSETILVVDDDELQRDVTKHLLDSLGYKVEVAASGEEAVALLTSDSADLVILDMVMPAGMDGAETFRRIRRLKPAQKAIIMSGYAASERVEMAQLLGVESFLRKPVRHEMLAAVVRRELDRTG